MRPLTPTEITTALDKWRVPYVLIDGWKTRDNGSRWSDKASVTGLMSHHTAGDAADNLELKVLTDGREGLRGPLCNFGVGDDAILDVIAAGSANHAGKGDPDTLKIIQKDAAPLDREIRPDQSSASATSVGGNSRLYGWEVYYGIRNDPTMNPKQHRLLILSQVAILDALDYHDPANEWTAGSLIGHREWTKAKIDPSGVKMFEERKLVNAVRKAGPAAAKVWFDTGKFPSAPTIPGGPVTPTPTPAQKPRYSGTQAGQENVQAFLASDAWPTPSGAPDNPYCSGQSWHKLVGGYTRNTLVGVTDLQREVAELKTLVQTLVDKFVTPTTEQEQP